MLFIKTLGGYHAGDKWINIWGNPKTVNIDWQKQRKPCKENLL